MVTTPLSAGREPSADGRRESRAGPERAEMVLMMRVDGNAVAWHLAGHPHIGVARLMRGGTSVLRLFQVRKLIHQLQHYGGDCRANAAAAGLKVWRGE
ncbi:hypothetical protein KCP74_20830 [Salmonella enterica subsp. enterica]|nr:hypothetical protein KCP74_20830 [Salmonella enterica subsp. enterica]